jgi:hypothetical protein
MSCTTCHALHSVVCRTLDFETPCPAFCLQGMKNAVTKLVPGPQTRRERRAEARRASRTASFVNEKVAKRTVWSGVSGIAVGCYI